MQKYDKVIVLAKKEKEVITACKWGDLWFFVYESDVDGGRIGDAYTSETQILNAARDYILNQSGYSFEECHLLDVVPKSIQLSNEEIVAIKQALLVISQSSSDYADSSSYYLNKILARL